MNPWQFAQQIKSRLQAARWDDLGGTEGLIFGGKGSVVVFAGQPTDEQLPIGFPWALVGIDSGEFDPDHPDHLLQRFTVVLGAQVAGDRNGELAIIGGAAADLGRSAGRGVAELAGRASSYIESLTGADGSRVILSGSSTSAPVTLGKGRHLAMAEIGLSAVCFTAPYYSAPQRLRYEGTRWIWDGAHCESRFDFVSYVLVKRQGGVPPSSISDGDVIYTGTAPKFTGDKGGGYTWGVFARYSARGGSSAEAYSDPEVGSYRVAT